MVCSAVRLQGGRARRERWSRRQRPACYGVGVAFGPQPGLTVALDYLRIEWGGAAGYDPQGIFAFRAQNVGRIGVSYEINRKWTARAGYSFANNNVDSNHRVANMYGPGITQAM